MKRNFKLSNQFFNQQQNQKIGKSQEWKERKWSKEHAKEIAEGFINGNLENNYTSFGLTQEIYTVIKNAFDQELKINPSINITSLWQVVFAAFIICNLQTLGANAQITDGEKQAILRISNNYKRNLQEISGNITNGNFTMNDTHVMLNCDDGLNFTMKRNETVYQRLMEATDISNTSYNRTIGEVRDPTKICDPSQISKPDDTFSDMRHDYFQNGGISYEEFVTGKKSDSLDIPQMQKASNITSGCGVNKFQFQEVDKNQTNCSTINVENKEDQYIIDTLERNQNEIREITGNTKEVSHITNVVVLKDKKEADECIGLNLAGGIYDPNTNRIFYNKVIFTDRSQENITYTEDSTTNINNVKNYFTIDLLLHEYNHLCGLPHSFQNGNNTDSTKSIVSLGKKDNTTDEASIGYISTMSYAYKNITAIQDVTMYHLDNVVLPQINNITDDNKKSECLKAYNFLRDSTINYTMPLVDQEKIQRLHLPIENHFSELTPGAEIKKVITALRVLHENGAIVGLPSNTQFSNTLSDATEYRKTWDPSASASNDKTDNTTAIIAGSAAGGAAVALMLSTYCGYKCYKNHKKKKFEYVETQVMSGERPKIRDLGGGVIIAG
ncbi:hypothetical protein [Candidatus Deianiraea vastatrix]|uniref:Uncharacterized protein n=1 Tax=Candidatus Deianiraea vastatrix TaxID=2163644 RepID=A0A5B8XFN5_9RICK|nr:hypothetical protein [Candidatus Deianiraea vastatrix]QED23184.1 hypothetical protein Deia_00380 [Candidatus Deianiraea vastatrix]